MRNLLFVLMLLNCTLFSGIANAGFFLTPWDAVLERTFDVSKSEWWYTIGFVSGKNQKGQERHFGFMVNVIRGADLYISPSFFVHPSTSIHVALLDLDNKVHFTSQQAALGPELGTFNVAAGTAAEQFAARGNFSSTGTLQSRFRVGGSNFSMDLTEEPEKNQAEFGEKGIVNNNSLGKAVYVSRTRQTVQSGSTIQLNGEIISVSGLSWEDHQVTNIKQTGTPIRWNWFAVLLKDKTEVMAYQIEEVQTGKILKNYAGHVLSDGKVKNLDDSFKVTESTHLPYGGIKVPTAWNISLPSIFEADISHTVPLPAIVTTAGQIKGAYFEGPCNIQNDRGKTGVEAVWAEYFDGRLFH